MGSLVFDEFSPSYFFPFVFRGHPLYTTTFFVVE